jgi:hypothetical protein
MDFKGNQRIDVIACAHALNQKAERAKTQHFCDPTLAFSDPIHTQFLSVWQSRAAARAMPCKSEISLRDLKDFLGDIVICQRLAENPSRYIWRLVGSKVATVVGHVIGKSFEESAPAENAGRWTDCCDLVLDGGQPLRFLGRVYLKDREYLNAENFFVPLADNDGKPTYVMGLCRYAPRISERDESWESQIASLKGSASRVRTQ